MEKELIDRSIDYILAHFHEGVTVGDVAKHFHFSEAYFNRSFKMATGKSVYEFILRLKMDQSAVDIKLQKNKPITQVGLDYGYSATNYSTAFKKHHRLSPAEFRQSTNVSGMESPFYPQGRRGFDSFSRYDSMIFLRELGDMTVAYERVVGNYIHLKQKWPAFIAENRRYCRPDTLYIERFYDDPAVTDPNGCIYDICMTVKAGDAPANTAVIPGGKYAVYHYQGKIEDIFCSVQGVFCVWLPQSGCVMDQRYGLNIYRSMDDTSPTVSFDLCIPIQ